MSGAREIRVVEDVAASAAELIAARVRAGGRIALSGGSTPRAAHLRVAALELDWSRTELWFGDERAVAPDHEHSNYAMAKASLLDRIAGAQPEVHRIRGELGHERAAASYAEELADAFGGAPPAMDLLLLGLGPDAHCASLFPGDAALGERERLAVGVATPGMAPLVSRVTVTLPVVNAAREVVFLISGADKAEAVARAFGGAPDPDAPASLVRPRPGSLTVLLDAPAAAELGERR
ncbi:MAG: 6-phosphogluconolactonase [Thermoleophilaceae bacterium]